MDAKTQNLIDEWREHFDPVDRVSAMEEIEAAFCRGCGHEQPAEGRCQCQNDE